MFRRLLIANRGEIAVRIIRACREMGVESVTVYSEADAASPHARLADLAVAIGGAAAYLDGPALIDAARSTNAEAIHPGYGFLAESAGFAESCAEAGLLFVGPPAEAIAAMGSKIASRAHAAAAGVPVVPGETPSQDLASMEAAAARLGYPVLVKASAGGGGKGMRVVRDRSELAHAVEAARHEARAAFGDGTLYLEHVLERPRHVEVQVFGDAHGQVVHLFERDCSVQRRHQKIVEESPSAGIDPGLRERMGDAAVRVARQIGYRNAGTVEFLVERAAGGDRFYFLEMNTRLQVEHPVTEATLGVDLVRAQLTVAAGQALPWRQEDLRPRGHAIECRIYAEDPESGFLPQAGRLEVYREPRGPWLRVDSGVEEGCDVSLHYDPLLAKLVSWGETREVARARAVAALRSYPILGIRTNVPFLVRVLEHQRFRQAAMDTAFLDSADALASLRQIRGDGGAPAPGDAPASDGSPLPEAGGTSWLPLALAVAAAHDERTPASIAGTEEDPWDRLSRWGRS